MGFEKMGQITERGGNLHEAQVLRWIVKVV
jgi:hypothetical protein